MIDVDIYYDKVVVLGTTIKRPSCISVSQWYRLWERMRWKMK
jgi:hypothetical protein